MRPSNHRPDNLASTSSQVADLSHDHARLRVSGADRVDFLHGQCTNDAKRLRVGESCYAAFLNAKGKMRGDAYIVCMEDAFLLEASAGLRESLEKFIITEDVSIEDVSDRYGAWLLIEELGANSRRGGPSRPTKTAKSAVGRAGPSPPWFEFHHPLGTGVISSMLMTPTMTENELEILRIEAGIPKWGADMDENTIPIEAGLEARAISYDKGCYIGQETIARIKTYGHVNRHLVQMTVGADRLPVSGDRIVTGDKEIGHITSAAYSNRLGKILALGYVRREFAVAGTKLTIGGQTAEVVRIV
jgi:folate-binding protein YgfZ